MRLLTRRRANGQRGAILVLAAASLVMVIVAVAFVIDIANQVMTKRQLHTIADIAAEDALTGLKQPNPQAAVQQIAVISAARNHFIVGSPAGNALTAVPGHWDATTRTFTTPGTPPLNAVQVSATTVVTRAFLQGTQQLNAVAIATDEGITGLQIGTYAGRSSLDASGVAFFDGLLCSALTPQLNPCTINLDALGYQGLASADVSLAQLETALGLGTTSSLAALTSTAFPDKQVLAAAATVLQNNGNTGASATLAGISQAMPTAQTCTPSTTVAPTPPTPPTTPTPPTSATAPTTPNGVSTAGVTRPVSAPAPALLPTTSIPSVPSTTTSVPTSLPPTSLPPTTLPPTTAPPTTVPSSVLPPTTISSANPCGSTNVTLANLYGVASGGTTVGVGDGSVIANEATLNAADLLTNTSELALANGQNAVGFNFNPGIAGVSSVNVQMGVIQAAQPRTGLACGSDFTAPPLGSKLPNCAYAETAQVRAQLTFTLPPVTILGSVVPVQVPIYLTSASGQTWVTAVPCWGDTDGQAEVDATAQTQAAYASIGQLVNPQNLTLPPGPPLPGGATPPSVTTTIPAVTTTISQGVTTTISQTTPGQTQGTPLGDVTVTAGVIASATLSATALGNVNLNVSDLTTATVPGANGTNAFTGPFDRSDHNRGVTPQQDNQNPWRLAAAGQPLGQQLASAYGNVASQTAPLVSVTVAGQTYVGVSNIPQSIQAPIATGTDAINSEVKSLLNSLDSGPLSQFANALAVSLGGADILNYNVANSSLANTIVPPNGVDCSKPAIVQ